ncbi:unnamed protein product [Rotaria sordida]|uniref:Uncharacterized protein n=1 Tax=Rotaria sordida TaxID=392033 RepID=A0A815YEK5_9BILA|nr:unnamed protein product [Rotaria sordida]CAF1681327.1 unnamed protein product [Rotaria sordida]
MFIIDLYNYLCNKENIDYIAELKPNYIKIALKFCETNLDIFRNTVQNSSFGEEKFKKEFSLYFYQTNNSTERKILIQLYTAFYGLTDDLIDMIQRIEYVDNDDGWKYLKHIKQVSNRDVIEKIFKCLDSISCYVKSRCFSSILKLLIRFAQTDIVFLLEIHQHISPFINNFLCKDDDRTWNDKKDIFEFVLNLSCIRKISLPHSKEKIVY